MKIVEIKEVKIHIFWEIWWILINILLKSLTYGDIKSK